MAPECHPEPFAFCHPERSEGSRPTQGRLREGSQVLENTRFFALLRMTGRLDRGFFSRIRIRTGRKEAKNVSKGISGHFLLDGTAGMGSRPGALYHRLWRLCRLPGARLGRQGPGAADEVRS